MSENQDLLNAARVFAQETGKPVTTEPLHYAVIPEDSQIISLEEYQYAHAPSRIKAKLEVTDDESFIDYFKDFREDQVSRVFADRDSRTLTGYLDYHGIEEPAFLDHVVTLRCIQTEEYKVWIGSNGKNLSQVEFASLIDDNISDITLPSGSMMRETARDLRAKRNADFASGVVLESGAVSIRYEEQIRGTVGANDLEVPETFTISIPVFKGGVAYSIQARLQYSITEQKKLQFRYILNKPEKRLDEEFDRRIGMIEGALQGMKVLLGKVIA